MDYRELPVLVTGAGGFIGRHLCRELVARGADLIPVVRPGGSRSEFEHQVELDITRQDALLEFCRRRRPRVVFHLAASLDRTRGLAALEPLVASNVLGTINVLRAAAAAAVEVVVHTGTCDEYGRNPPPFSETMQPDPVTPYAASKATATMWCRTFHRSVGLACISARLFMVYGPQQPSGFFTAQLLEAMRSGLPLAMTAGEQTRDFTWVEDAVEALLRLGRSPHLGGEVYNVCTGRETPLREVVALLEEVSGQPVPVQLGVLPYRESELFRVWGSPFSLHGAIGYKPKTELREGLSRLLKAMESASDPGSPGASGERRAPHPG